jgi:hypothetical protein
VGAVALSLVILGVYRLSHSGSPAEGPSIAQAVQSYQGGKIPEGTHMVMIKLEKNYARVDLVSPGKSQILLLKKDASTWKVVFAGQKLTQAEESRLGFPPGFASITAAPQASSTPSPTSLITKAVLSHLELTGRPAPGVKLVLVKLQGDYAKVNFVGPGQKNFILVKKQETDWKVFFVGQVIDRPYETHLGFPAGFADSAPDASPITLYTY